VFQATSVDKPLATLRATLHWQRLDRSIVTANQIGSDNVFAHEDRNALLRGDIYTHSCIFLGAQLNMPGAKIYQLGKTLRPFPANVASYRSIRLGAIPTVPIRVSARF
jgi:hypothetical protein